jgi:DNA-binding CsgD family transcriptional regulator
VLSGHGREFVASRESAFDLKARGSFKWWVCNRRAMMMDKTGATDAAGTRIPLTKCESEDIERFSLGLVAVHGVVDPFANTGTYLGFSGVPKAHPKQTLAALDLIAPVLHNLYLRTKQVEESTVELRALTDRQRDLVDLAALGLSDKEIALRLGISDNTVGNHFRAIYARLGISKRHQLVARLK